MLTSKPPEEKVEAFKFMLLYVLSHHPEIAHKIRQLARGKKDTLVNNPLTKNQILHRISGVASYPYFNKNCLYFAKELYDAFAEYTRFDVLKMLKDNDLIINYSVQKRHPLFRKKQRAFVLNVER